MRARSPSASPRIRARAASVTRRTRSASSSSDGAPGTGTTSFSSGSRDDRARSGDVADRPPSQTIGAVVVRKPSPPRFAPRRPDRVMASDAAAPRTGRLTVALLDQLAEAIEVGLRLAGGEPDRRADPLGHRVLREGHLELHARCAGADRLE